MRPRVLITGATAGIGEATARQFLAAGYHVIALGRRADRLAALTAEFPDAVTAAIADVTDAASLDALPTETWNVDVLVNNAGLARGTEPMQSADPADWDAMIDTNIRGLLQVTRRVAPTMAARGRGHIINLGSVAGRWVYPGGGVYCATKHAVGAITEGLRLDLHGSGVRVSNIEPGLVETEFSLVRFAGDADRAGAVYADTTPLTPNDVAEAILWCATRPSHVNVQELVLYPTDQASVRDVVRRPS